MFFDLWFRICSLFRRRSLEPELNDEIEFHFAQETEKLMRSGLPRPEAARQARLAFGFAGLVKEETRAAHGIRWIEELGRDIKFGLRLFRLNPGFATVAVLSLALGIGANTAIFQLLDTVRLRNLPVSSPEQLRIVRIGGDGPFGNFNSRFSDLSYAQWQEIDRRQQVFSQIAVWTPRRFNLAGGGEMRPAEGMLVSGAFFNMLGVSALRGRVLDRNDDTAGCDSTAAVISHAFWQREFSGNAGAVGGQIRIDGHPFTIVGITPPRFFGVEVGRSYDIAVPLCAEARLTGADSQLTANRHNYWLCAIGRLRDGWNTERANAHLRAISTSIFPATTPEGYTSADERKRYNSMWLHAMPAANGVSWLRVGYEKPLFLLLGSAALVLLIACGNLSNLLLARANVRTQEIRVRLALGASKARLIRQLLTESLLLAVSGATLGLAVASAASRALVSFLVTADNPVTLDTRLDWRVLSFSIVVALITCALFGLAPALRGAASAPSSARSVTGGRDQSMLRRALAATQIALCIVLVAGAILFGRSAYNLLTVDVGFKPEHVLVASFDTRRLGFSKERQKSLFNELLDRLRATPGVVDAAHSDIIPMSGWESNTIVKLDGTQNVRASISMVSPGYFRTLGTPLFAGRDFSPRDNEKTETIAIVNEAFATKFLSGANPIGHTLHRPDTNKTCRIVGLVRNTKYRILREDFRPIIFLSSLQFTFTFNYARYVVRSTSPLPEVTKAIRASVASVSPAIDIDFVPLDTQIRQSVLRERLMAAVGGGFGLLAGLLAAVGLYGLLSYSVEARRNEIGIRMALGADRRAVVGLVVREAGWLLGVGVIAGLVITLAAGRAAATLLYGLQPNDPLTLAGTVVTLLGLGMVSAYVPARRAAALDPLTALRQE